MMFFDNDGIMSVVETRTLRNMIPWGSGECPVIFTRSNGPYLGKRENRIVSNNGNI